MVATPGFRFLHWAMHEKLRAFTSSWFNLHPHLSYTLFNHCHQFCKFTKQDLKIEILISEFWFHPAGLRASARRRAFRSSAWSPRLIAVHGLRVTSSLRDDGSLTGWSWGWFSRSLAENLLRRNVDFWMACTPSIMDIAIAVVDSKNCV